MSSPSDAEVIGRSLGEPEAFGLIYDRHAATLLRFLGRRAGSKVAEGLVGELFRIAFERRKTFDPSRATALPWLYGIGSNLFAKHRRGAARRLRASAPMAAGREAAGPRSTGERKHSWRQSGRRSRPGDDRRSFRGFRMRTSVPRCRSWSARLGSARSRRRGAYARTARSTTRWSSSATA